MTGKSIYEKSEWKKTDFIQNYVDNSEGFIVERRRMLGIMKSFYTWFIKDKTMTNHKVLDLGCGDGILSRELANVDTDIEITLLDGSEEMLETAGKLLWETKATYIKSTFQELIQGKKELKEYDFVVSSLAIHHLTMDEKSKLFQFIYSILAKGGAFLNIDVVTSDRQLEVWYLDLWEEWVKERERLNQPDKSLSGISKSYKENKDNLPDTLDDQIQALRTAGFKKVDCFYKYGIFTMFGGFK